MFQIQIEFSKLRNFTPVTAAYFIWNDPMMSVGNDTFINDMMKRFGLINVFADLIRYPEITVQDLQKANPELILLSSEPFPFMEKHISQYQKINPQSKIILVDGELFSWYGSRLIKAPAYFMSLRSRITSS